MMPAVRVILVALLVAAGCGVRPPARMDVAALVKKRGPVEARRDLTIRVLAHPRDVQARLALAEVAETTGRPSEAIDQLEAVVRLGGPLGTRWHDSDRARLGRLLLARGRVRIARGAETAFADLERAGSLGAAATPDELAQARVAIAIAQLKHTDAKERAKGRAAIANAALTPSAAGAREQAAPAERGAYGAWAWSVGARREAYDALAGWRVATKPPRDENLQGAYLRALAWWSPVWLGEVPLPPKEELVGPERCWFPGADCSPPDVEDPTLSPAPTLDVDPRAAVAAYYAATRTNVGVAALVPVATAFLRDPTIAERLGRDYVASAVDAALAHATLGALFDALADPARARVAWHAAVESSSEPAFVRGLAEATARAGDGPAALVFAIRSSAAWGDPAVVWVGVATALVGAGQYADALTAARSGLDLAGPEVLPRALDVAIAASRALGRAAQADALVVQRAQVAPRLRTDDADAYGALAAHRAQPTASTVARLWVASRALPRDVELRAALVDALDPDDPRRPTVAAELVDLAGDPDPARALAAVRALRW
jgi:hypothetical protein